MAALWKEGKKKKRQQVKRAEGGNEFSDTLCCKGHTFLR